MNILNEVHYNKDLYCPRCHGDDLVDYGETFQCVSCNMEFEKDDIGTFDDDEILSIREKLALRPFFWLDWF